MQNSRLIALRTTFTSRFNLGELRAFCSTLGINYENLAGDNLEQKAEQFISYLERHGRIEELVRVGKQHRPDISWNELITGINPQPIISDHTPIFISHDNSDTEFARIIAQTITRITLGQVKMSFSADVLSTGGFTPVDKWLNETRTKLRQTKIIVVLLTPQSIKSQWIYFESGFGASSADCEIVPVGIGINCSSEVPFPLAMYQCYQLSDYESLKAFTQRIFSKNHINFDEELARPFLEKTITQITELSASFAKPPQRQTLLTTAELLSDVKEHVDRRFIELLGKLEQPNSSHSDAPNEIVAREYTIPLYINFPELETKQFLKIVPGDTIQDVYDRIYFLLSPIVRPFTYLEKWILRERISGINLVMREVTGMIPAQYVFRPEMVWEAHDLSKPYAPADSSSLKALDRWYGLEDLKPR